MYKIENLKNYLNQTNEFIRLAKEIYQLNSNIDYKDFKKWYLTKQIPGILKNERDILFIKNSNKEIIGISCLKKTNNEKKICNLFVKEEYRYQGIGTILIEESMKWLETKKPLITFPDYKLELFKPFIKKYNWQLIEVINNLYNNYSKELCYNDTLIKPSNLENELHQKLIKVLKYRKNQLEK